MFFHFIVFNKLLDFLDLHNNELKEVVRLEQMKRLKFLNLSGNKSLSEEKILAQLQRIGNLRHLILNKLFTDEQRIRKLSKIAENHPMMVALDTFKITVEERVLALKENGATNFEQRQYAFRAIIMEQIVQIHKRSYKPRRVAPGQLYKASDVTILHLSNLGLIDFGCDFGTRVCRQILAIVS